MPYVGSGQLPIEHASKIGHMKLIQDPHIQRMLSEFESMSPTTGEPIGFKSGHVDIKKDNNINFVISIDGGEAVVPNEIRSEKRLAFISVCALLLRVRDIEEMRQNPIIDPREIPSKIQIWHNPAMIPLSGIRHPNESIRDTIRKTVDSKIGRAHV